MNFIYILKLERWQQKQQVPLTESYYSCGFILIQRFEKNKTKEDWLLTIKSKEQLYSAQFEGLDMEVEKCNDQLL